MADKIPTMLQIAAFFLTSATGTVFNLIVWLKSLYEWGFGFCSQHVTLTQWPVM